MISKLRAAKKTQEAYTFLHKRYLVWSKLKAFADDNPYAAQMLEFVLDNSGKHCGKMIRLKHCGKIKRCKLPAFSPFPTMFSNCFFTGLLSLSILW